MKSEVLTVENSTDLGIVQKHDEFTSLRTSELSMSVEREAKRLGVDKYDPVLNNPSIEEPKKGWIKQPIKPLKR